MVKNYFKSTWRNFLKHKGFSAINIFSLTIGFAVCLVIYLFIHDETSFDRQHSQIDNIFRLCEIQSFPGTNTQKVALSMPPMGPTLRADFPEVEDYTRYWNWGERLWETADKKLLVETFAVVDSTFLEVFDFPLIAGNRSTVLDEPNSIVISKQVAENFFHSIDVVGRSMKWGDRSWKITGVMKDIPENSHLQFDILGSISTHAKDNPEFNTNWGSNYVITYLKLNAQTEIADLEKKLPEYLVRNSGVEDAGDYYELFLQPLTELHLGSIDIEHDYQNYRKFNGTYIDVFILIGIFILAIASINFMNLSSARANTRSREVGVRKCIGASSRQLFSQFLFESVLMSILAFIMALLLVGFSLPALNNLISRELSLIILLYQPRSIIICITACLSLGILCGLYPAIFMASFRPAVILKGMDIIRKKSLFRSSLIVLQFGLALAMIVATLIVVQQLYYMKNSDLGFSRDHILLVTMNKEANEKFEVIKQDLRQMSNVLGVTASGQRLGNNFHQWSFKAKTDSGMLNITPSNVLVEYDYLDVYDIKLTRGRNFSREYASDNGLAFIINESFAKELGYEDPIGEKVGHGFYPDDSLGTIIGVTEDFNFNSLHYKVNTLSMVIHTSWNYDELSVKLSGGNIREGVEQVEEVWAKHIRDWPFKYEFLDDHFDELYKSDTQLSSVVTIIAVLSVVIGCMGLFGLAVISMERRIKEIGIRKVLGAGVHQLFYLLSKDFAILIIVSFAIAAPLTYLYLSEWLNNFAYRIEINLLTFVLGLMVALSIAMLTISHNVLKTARTNPVESLKYE